MLLYINGCSFAVQSDGKRYSDFLSTELNCDVVNAAKPCSCNDRILRTSLRDLLSLRKIHNDITVLISLSFIVRTEVWDTLNRSAQPTDDGDFISYQFFNGSDWVEKFKMGKNTSTAPSYLNKYGIEWTKLYDPEAEITKLFTELIMFIAWCENNNIKYLIFNGGTPLENIDYSAPFVSSFKQELDKNPRVLNLTEFSFGGYSLANGYIPYDADIYGIKGHPGEDAHKNFANFLLENYLN
jgi:hypothetical protein